MHISKYVSDGLFRFMRMVVGVTLAGCGADAGGSSPQDAGPMTPPDDGAANADGAGPGPDAIATETSTAPALTLSIDPGLDQDGDDVKATAIMEARLFDENGAVKGVAAVSAGSAVFALAGLKAGDYFVVLNGDADDAIPTRIDDATRSTTQRVGQKLRASYIGPQDNPTYRVNTYSVGQKQSPVVKYSDGTVVPGEQPYVIYSFATSQLEIRLLGSGAKLSSLPLPNCYGHSSVPADAWLLNTTNQDHHGDAFNADGGAADCTGCHWYGGMKQYAYSVITPTNGWCFECHYGNQGSGAGFVDPTK